MRIVHMLPDYEILCRQTPQIGNYEAYVAYTRKYELFFKSVFQYLYCRPIEALRGYIETVDFCALKERALLNMDGRICQRIIAAAEEYSGRMGIAFDFELYLGLEMGNIGGASLPAASGAPCLYMGIDREIEPGFIDVFLPHELHHMLRAHVTGEQVYMTLHTRMIAEGLASYASLWVHSMDWNEENVAKALGVELSQSAYMMQNSQRLVRRLFRAGDVPLTPQVMGEYFTSQNETGLVRVPGYYVGMYVTYLLTQRGLSFPQLTAMPAQAILDAYKKAYPSGF